MRGIVAAVLFLALALSGVHRLAASPTPDGPQKVSVEQLQQIIAEAHDKPDADLAQALQGIELTERLSTAPLAKLKAELPGDISRQALTVLADSSAFLPLPASEIPAIPAPDPATQRQIMALVVNYVTRTVRELPNFFATRETTRFEDRPQVTYSYLPLHYVGKSSRHVVYRNGLEIGDPDAGKAGKRESSEQGLVSWGEFGPILSTVLLDAAQSKLVWSHWEQGTTGPVAVFTYEVPSQKSHYEVQACCLAAAATFEDSTFKERAGYHGEMTVDPATGVILRVTVDAEMGPGAPLSRAAIMVEYGTVTIGGKSVICPERSVALSRMQYAHASIGAHSVLDKNPQQTLLNDVAFEQYHQLRGEARILPAGASEDGTDSPIANSEEAAEAPSQPAPPASTSPQSHNSEVAVTPAPAPVSAPAAPVAPPEPEVSMAAANGIPDAPADAQFQPPSGFVLKVTSRLVDVGLVAMDKKGHPVTDLKPADFEVYDNGRKQEVKFFSTFTPPLESSRTESAAADNAFSNRVADAPPSGAAPASTPAPAPASNGSNATILLFDEGHIAWSDLSHARQETIKFLGSLPPGERVAFYTMSGLGFRVLTEITTDHAALIARLQKWMPTAQSMSNAQEDETRNRQQFETVHNLSDLNSVNGNQSDTPDSESPVDPQLLALGSDPARASLLILRGVARHLAAVPGHKNLVWVSSDNVFADWRDQQVGTDKVSNGVDIYALHAQEAMNDAHVSVYPFDVSQLEAGGIGADLGNRNVELNPTTMLPPGTSAPREGDAGRTKASMLQDLHPIQGPIRQVAEATGGRTIRRASDLAGALSGIVEDERATYQLSFYPDTPADGKYHSVTVKLADRKGVTLRYRTGYFYAQEPATMKERFQQAIWQPLDASEIRVTAAVPQSASGSEVKVNIAAADLDFVQGSGRRIDQLDIFFIQRDDAGLHAQMEGQTLGLRLLPATYQNALTAGIPFQQPVKLKPGTGSLRVLVIDRNSGRMGSVTIPDSALRGAR